MPTSEIVIAFLGWLVPASISIGAQLYVIRDLERKVDMARRFIRDMVVTEVAWTTPDALWQDPREDWWLDPTYFASGSYREPSTATLRVHRKPHGWLVFHQPGDAPQLVKGLRPRGDVPDESPPPPVCKPNPLAESQDQLAKIFEELGERELALLQREIAAQLRTTG